MTYRFTADNPAFIYDDVLRRVVGVRHPGGQEEYFGFYGSTSGLVPASGFGAWRPVAGSSVKVDLTGTTSETTLATATLPGGTMGNTGFCRIWSLWSYTNSANSKIPRIRFGGTVLASNTLTTTASAPLVTHIGNRTASTQVAGIATGLVSTTANPINTAAINTAADVAITFTGTLASAAETMSLESYLIEACYGA